MVYVNLFTGALERKCDLLHPYLFVDKLHAFFLAPLKLVAFTTTDGLDEVTLQYTLKLICITTLLMVYA